MPTENAKSVFESYYWLPCETAVEIPVPGFTVGDLLKLHVGAIVQTATPANSELPIRVKKIVAGAGQLEVAGNQLAIRITELI